MKKALPIEALARLSLLAGVGLVVAVLVAVRPTVVDHVPDEHRVPLPSTSLASSQTANVNLSFLQRKRDVHS
uniref:Uncharacterized protein n=1 Tax=Leersia perrieri TaxID=77586 RepID=A0A0D9XTF9_9ORYZ